MRKIHTDLFWRQPHTNGSFLDGKGLDEFLPYSRSANATKADETFTMSIADAQRLLASNNLARNARFKGRMVPWNGLGGGTQKW